MKRLLAFLLVLLSALTAFVSCADDAEYENIEYRENGLCFILPNTMRRKSSATSEFYFTNQNIGVAFNARKLTAEVLESEDMTPGLSAKEYVDKIIERNDFDKESIFYTYFERFDHYNFRYNYGEDGEELFFYVTVLGGGDNLWYVEMYCENDLSADYLPMFERWRKSLGTY